MERPGRGPLPDPWRASLVTVVLAAVAGAALGAWLAALEGAVHGVIAGAILVCIPVAAELQAACRLRRALALFAAGLPGQGRVAYQRWTSEQGIRWPALGVSVEGAVVGYGVPRLIVRTPSGDLVVKPRHARQAGLDLARRFGLARPAA